MALCVGVMKCKKCGIDMSVRDRHGAVCWRDEVPKMQVQEANVVDYRNAARCKSYSDNRQCWRNTSVHGHVACLVGRARDRWMTRYDSRLSRRPARVYVGVVCV